MNKKLLIEHLLNQAKLSRKLSRNAAKRAYKEGDIREWDMSRLFLGQAFAFEEMVVYLKGQK